MRDFSRVKDTKYPAWKQAKKRVMTQGRDVCETSLKMVLVFELFLLQFLAVRIVNKIGGLQV